MSAMAVLNVASGAASVGGLAFGLYEARRARQAMAALHRRVARCAPHRLERRRTACARRAA